MQPFGLVEQVKNIAKRGELDVAKRVYQTCGKMFRYAIVNGVAQKNPCSDIKPSAVLKAQKRTNFTRIDAKEAGNETDLID